MAGVLGGSAGGKVRPAPLLLAGPLAHAQAPGRNSSPRASAHRTRRFVGFAGRPEAAVTVQTALLAPSSLVSLRPTTNWYCPGVKGAAMVHCPLALPTMW